MIGIKISQAKPEDAKGITLVLYKTWLATYPSKKHNITTQDIKYMYKGSFSEKNIKERAKKLSKPEKGKHTFVAKYSNKIVGVCGIFASDKNRIGTIYVIPNYQRKGIGKMLWSKASKFFNNKKETYLHVASYNTNAIKFYKNLGFKKIGKIFYDEKFKLRNGALIPEIKMVLKKKLKNES